LELAEKFGRSGVRRQISQVLFALGSGARQERKMDPSLLGSSQREWSSQKRVRFPVGSISRRGFALPLAMISAEASEPQAARECIPLVRGRKPCREAGNAIC
jgi:hypothetical protein